MLVKLYSKRLIENFFIHIYTNDSFSFYKIINMSILRIFYILFVK